MPEIKPVDGKKLNDFAGQLANETTVSASSLIQVITGVSQWVQISAGQNTMGGIAKPN